MSNKYFHLTVKEVVEETKDTKTIHFWHPIHNTVQYKAGQFLTVIPEIDGKKTRRSYSFSSSPVTDSSPAITIKRVEKGLVSNYLCEHLKVGDTLEVMEPMGHFCVEPQSAAKKNYVFVGAGSGITPLFSMIKTILKSEPQSSIELIYGSRFEDQIIFKSALNELEKNYSDRFKILYIVSKPSASWAGLKGRINQASIVYYLKQELGTDILNSHYFICGPEELTQQVKSSLAIFEVPETHIHSELFTSSHHEPIQIDEEDGQMKERIIKIHYEGKTHELTVLPSQTILEAALEADIDLPYSCQAGMCTACMGKCTAGKVGMDEEDGLTQGEIDKGYILTCVAHPLTDGVEIEIE